MTTPFFKTSKWQNFQFCDFLTTVCTSRDEHKLESLDFAQIHKYHEKMAENFTLDGSLLLNF